MWPYEKFKTRLRNTGILLCILIHFMPWRAKSFPGGAHLTPKIHFAPSYVSDVKSWHDIAGAITHRGVHHVYQGKGFHHAYSTDLVHWFTDSNGPKQIHERYLGMRSYSTPCSGFITKDPNDNNRICAGFRQCHSTKGVDGMSHSWDVPLELRCALDSDNLRRWNNFHPEYLFNVSWYRQIPYDPARPFQDDDGMWYILLSADGCNSTTQTVPCGAGGSLYMWKSPFLRGPNSSWEPVGSVFTSNETVLGKGTHLTKEFVTIDYIGTIEGDPHPQNKTRIFLDNVGGNGGGVGCCQGTTRYFPVIQEKPGSPMKLIGKQKMIDWAAFILDEKDFRSNNNRKVGLDLLSGTGSRGFSMARTLGSEEIDQVTRPGRRILIGWVGESVIPELNGVGSAQSLPRELTLDSNNKDDVSILQRFVPELKILRKNHTHAIVTDDKTKVRAGLQCEIIAIINSDACGNSLSSNSGSDSSDSSNSQSEFADDDIHDIDDDKDDDSNDDGECGVTVLGNTNSDDSPSTKIILSKRKELVLVDATSQGDMHIRGGPLPQPDEDNNFVIHIIVDHSIVEIIVNDKIAFVVYSAPSSHSGGYVQLFGIYNNDTNSSNNNNKKNNNSSAAAAIRNNSSDSSRRNSRSCTNSNNDEEDTSQFVAAKMEIWKLQSANHNYPPPPFTAIVFSLTLLIVCIVTMYYRKRRRRRRNGSSKAKYNYIVESCQEEDEEEDGDVVHHDNGDDDDISNSNDQQVCRLPQ